MKNNLIDRLLSYWLGLALIISMLIVFYILRDIKVVELSSSEVETSEDTLSSLGPSRPSMLDQTLIVPKAATPELPKESAKNLIHLNYQNAQLVASQITSNHIVLTFDDGPDPKTTPKILSQLRQYGAKATFFVVGQQVLNHCPLLKMINTEGHEIANHSHSHPYFTMIPLVDQKQEINKTNQAIQTCIPGYQVQWFRPPFGRSNANTQFVLNELQLNSALWTIDTEDWRRSESSGTILDSLISSQGKDIILMHDGVIEMPSKPEEVPPEIRGKLENLKAQFSRDRQATVEALKEFLEENKQQGYPYRFVTLSEAFNL